MRVADFAITVLRKLRCLRTSVGVHQNSSQPSSVPVAATFLPPLLLVGLTLGLPTLAVSLACTALAPLAGAGTLAGLAAGAASFWEERDHVGDGLDLVVG